MPFDLGNDATRLCPASRLIGEICIETAHFVRRPTDRSLQQIADPLLQDAVGVIEAAEEDAVAPFDLIGDHLPGIELKPQGVEDSRVRDFQKLHRQRQQFVARQAAMAFVKSFGQGKRDPGPRPDHCRLFDAEFHREGIGRLKADAPDVTGESVGIFRNHLDRPLLGPTRGDPIGTLRTNAGNSSCARKPIPFPPPEYIRRFSQFECNILIECNILKFPTHDKALKFHNLISRI